MSVLPRIALWGVLSLSMSFPVAANAGDPYKTMNPCGKAGKIQESTSDCNGKGKQGPAPTYWEHYATKPSNADSKEEKSGEFNSLHGVQETTVVEEGAPNQETGSPFAYRIR